MSILLDDLIRQKREETEDYEAFLRKAEELVRKMSQGQNADDVPDELWGKSEAIVIYNNLPEILSGGAGSNMVTEPVVPYGGGDGLVKLALEIDLIMRERAPAGWRGDDTREKEVLNALYPVMNRDRHTTKELFELLKDMKGYE
jgi:type I restriction enzyme R subunit